MGTIRALTSGGGEKRRAAQSANLKCLFEACIPGGFLLPSNHSACTHTFVGLDSGYCVCQDCGSEHFCGCNACPETVTRLGERICQITGCVTLENELREERDVNVRTGPSTGAPSHHCDYASKTPKKKNETRLKKRFLIQNDSTMNTEDDETSKKRLKKTLYLLAMQKYPHRSTSKKSGTVSSSISDLIRRGGGENLRNLIECTIREILSSDKTERCREQERKRNEIKELSVFSRGLREVVF